MRCGDRVDPRSHCRCITARWPLPSVRVRWRRTRGWRTDAFRRPMPAEGATHSGEPPAKVKHGENYQTDESKLRLIGLGTACLILLRTRGRRFYLCGRSDFHIRFRGVCRRLGGQSRDKIDPDFGPIRGKHQHQDDRQQDDHRRKSQAVSACLAAGSPRTSAEMRHYNPLGPFILSNGSSRNRDSGRLQQGKRCSIRSLAIICGWEAGRSL
jgi:hypothetical protein